MLRIHNASGDSGTVEIYAIDDSGARSGPATFTLNASAAVAFTATDLQSGNANLGLTGGVGTDAGDLRLQIETELDIVPLALVRAADGTLSAMHDTVRGETTVDSVQFRYEVPVFNPSVEVTRESRLRLINRGDAAAAVTIAGVDDSGTEGVGGEVELVLAAGGAKTLTSLQLEAGDTDVTGRLGAGTGSWRLTVLSDQSLQVVNIVASTAGYWNNLSTTAVPGAAPTDQAGFNERFVGSSVTYQAGSRRSTLEAQDNDRFAEMTEADGFTVTYMGAYSYAAIGPDAGRLTLDYDDENACRTNLYFSYRTSGWFASHCTSGDNPDGHWTGGRWFVEGEGDDGQDGVGDIVETTFEVSDMLPGVPTSGNFDPASTGGGSQVTATADGTTIALDNGGYFELEDGTRYTCVAADGCTIVNGAVTAGTVDGRVAGTGEVDRFPTFRTAARPGDQTYTVDTAIATLTLPEAIGGNGTLTYTLSPRVPGLIFNVTTRQLTGTPSSAGTYAMTYAVKDDDGDSAMLMFTLTVRTATSTVGSLGDCLVGLSVKIGESCTYPGTMDTFTVNSRGRGRFLSFLAGIRIRVNNQTINGRVYDFLASHTGDGVWRIDRIAGSTEPPTDADTDSDTVPSFVGASGPGIQSYAVGTTVDPLTLPAASGGNGALTYSLSPNVPGLTFDPTARVLSGTPTTAGTYDMTYAAADEDGDSATLSFVVSVTEPDGEDALSGQNGGSQRHIWRGVDLSYVNEMEDCGAVYRLNGETRDPYALFAEIGANVVRLRLWHTPEWTRYSTLADVTRSIRRAKVHGMAVLLDFHYSDDWADPSKQIIPAAWRDIGTTQGLARALHDYTYAVLSDLDALDLAPRVRAGWQRNQFGHPAAR